MPLLKPKEYQKEKEYKKEIIKEYYFLCLA
jgi:hypothetical protein